MSVWKVLGCFGLLFGNITGSVVSHWFERQTWGYIWIHISNIYYFMCGKYLLETGITSHHMCSPPTSLFLFTSNSVTLRTGLNQSSSRKHVKVAKSSHFLGKQRMFFGASFQRLHQLFQSVSHLYQLRLPPVPSHRKWGICITSEGYEKGHLFHGCRWQSALKVEESRNCMNECKAMGS